MRLEDRIDPAKHQIRLVPGFATADTGFVLHGGTEVPAFWMGHVDVQENDPLWLFIIDRPDFTSMAVVVGANGTPNIESERPSTGTVKTAPAGSDTVTVSTSIGDIQAAFAAAYTPAISDKVRLLWQDDDAWILGKSAKVPAPKKKRTKKDTPGVTRPPSKKGNGSETFTASSSATWATGTGSWNSRMKSDVYQGPWPGVGNAHGAWFYHNKPKKLKGKKSVKTEIWIPKRIHAGSYNSSVTVNLYLHYSAKRPGGDVTRGSKTTVSIPKNWKGGWKTLPASWGAQLIAGRGIGMAGGGYAGFKGVRTSSRSGQIKITWED